MPLRGLRLVPSHLGVRIIVTLRITRSALILSAHLRISVSAPLLRIALGIAPASGIVGLPALGIAPREAIAPGLSVSRIPIVSGARLLGIAARSLDRVCPCLLAITASLCRVNPSLLRVRVPLLVSRLSVARPSIASPLQGILALGWVWSSGLLISVLRLLGV